MTTSIQKELISLSPHLREEMVKRLVKALQGRHFDETELRKVIREVLYDSQANKDLEKVFIDLMPTIQKAAGSSNITVSGDVYGLIVGDRNTITQTFNGFLQDKP